MQKVLLVVISTCAAIATACQKHSHARLPQISRSENVLRARARFPPITTKDESILLNSFDSNSIDEWNYYYSDGLALCGKNQSMAQWTADKFSANGWTGTLAEYWVYLNYPVSHSLSLTRPDGTTFDASLEEDVLQEDPTTGYPNRVPTFNGYSWTGDASAEYVYVGWGQMDDFKRLKQLGVPLEGRIAIAKYGGPFRGLKVKNAQDNGMLGCILFTDPVDDGDVTEANGYAPYPHGPARQPSSVQRGSVEFLSVYPGDPTTPGYPSKQDSPRADTSLVTPRIPSLPISYVDAIPLLEALDGHGIKGSDVHRDNWVGALNVSYSTGPASGAILSMSNVMEDTITPLWDAIGIINGTHPDEVIIIGNHRDAWPIGGSADPHSGTAVLVELSKAFGKLLKTGWRPRRTIVLGSWDGEEYGLLGSTEWVEEYIPWLTGAAVSYLNIDIAVSGPIPYVDASPELHEIAKESMKKVIWPLGKNKQTLYDVWEASSGGEIGVLGSGSDFTSFLHKGIGSLDIGAFNGPTDPVYHYHSNYDSYHWMKTYGDPEFRIHKAMGQWLTLMVYHLSSDEIISFNLNDFADALNQYYKDLRKVVDAGTEALDTSPLLAAIAEFAEMAKAITAQRDLAETSGDAGLVDTVNHKFRDFNRGFISQGGLPGREFYQHVIFAPGLDTGYAPVTFPGITEAVEAGDYATATEWVDKTAAAILVAADILKP